MGYASSPDAWRLFPAYRMAFRSLRRQRWHTGPEVGSGMVLRVVIAEDSFLMREGIATVIGLDDQFDLVATSGSYDELIGVVSEHEPDVVITDIRMPPSQTDEGIRAANDLRTTHPEIGVVVLSQYVEPAYALRLFEDGSEGRAYLLKERVGDGDELLAAVLRVSEGGTVVDPKVVDALMRDHSRAKPSVLERLTDREREVLEQMATGASNGGIGDALFISARSVEKHINSIFTKFDLAQDSDTHRRVRAVLVYLSEGSEVS